VRRHLHRMAPPGAHSVQRTALSSASLSDYPFRSCVASKKLTLKVVIGAGAEVRSSPDRPAPHQVGFGLRDHSTDCHAHNFMTRSVLFCSIQASPRSTFRRLLITLAENAFQPRAPQSIPQAECGFRKNFAVRHPCMMSSRSVRTTRLPQRMLRGPLNVTRMRSSRRRRLRKPSVQPVQPTYG